MAGVFVMLTLLISCGQKPQKFTETFIEYFDTASSVTGYELYEEDFEANTAEISQLLREYHQLYDIYNSYDGINNIRTVNMNAGIAPVKVDKRVIDLIEYAEDIYALTNEKTDITMGTVLKIWHEYREEGTSDPLSARLPSNGELTAAAAHHGFDRIVIDKENSTVFITDSEMSLDLGAVAKGYATEQIARHLEEKGVTGYALNIGGNIRVVGDKPDGSKWTAAVTDPNGNTEQPYLMNIRIESKAFVTSGSYIRYYTVNGKRYHHIIDPETLYPKDEFSSISVLSKDSGLADCLSTALFCMSYEDGLRLIESLADTEAVWVRSDGEILYSTGFEACKE